MTGSTKINQTNENSIQCKYNEKIKTFKTLWAVNKFNFEIIFLKCGRIYLTQGSCSMCKQSYQLQHEQMQASAILLSC